MGARDLLEWQWNGYGRFHRNRTNVKLHVLTVPIFMAATVLLAVAAVRLSPLLGALALAGLVLPVLVQGKGHAMEERKAIPFTGAGNAVARLFLEQWVTVPRFVLSGGWSRADTGA